MDNETKSWFIYTSDMYQNLLDQLKDTSESDYGQIQYLRGTVDGLLMAIKAFHDGDIDVSKCDDCAYIDSPTGDYPCSECRRMRMDFWSLKTN